MLGLGGRWTLERQDERLLSGVTLGPGFLCKNHILTHTHTHTHTHTYTHARPTTPSQPVAFHFPILLHLVFSCFFSLFPRACNIKGGGFGWRCCCCWWRWWGGGGGGWGVAAPPAVGVRLNTEMETGKGQGGKQKKQRESASRPGPTFPPLTGG